MRKGCFPIDRDGWSATNDISITRCVLTQKGVILMVSTTSQQFPEILDAHERAARTGKRVLTDAEVLQQVRILADLMDNRFVIPGTTFRIGLDGLIGLIPGIGDVATTVISAYIVYLAHQVNLPRHVLARMIFNVAVDMTVGIVPVLGDALDVAWKANLKNVRLLERHLQRRKS